MGGLKGLNGCREKRLTAKIGERRTRKGPIWQRLKEENDFQARMVHLVPMEDGSILKIQDQPDGSVRFLSESISAATLAALVTAKGGDLPGTDY